jgi:hypothetical protein
MILRAFIVMAMILDMNRMFVIGKNSMKTGQ